MPASVVVGGQFGSEGKGKVALEIVRRDPSCAAVVRVGGTNSGHTAIDKNGRTRILRQLPASGIDGNVQIILPPGAYIDPEVFHREIAELGVGPNQVVVSRMARIITPSHRIWEAESQLGAAIGSTQSGTGASVLASAAREAAHFPVTGLLAEHVEELTPFLGDTTEILRKFLSDGKRIVIEGTQGFGLSVLHGGYWPKATARDTTAAGFVTEAGISPLDVDDVTMVLRCHPIRVAGESGALFGETTWDTIAAESGCPFALDEYTTVTKRLRRVGRFDAELVQRAIAVNRPTRIVLNHLDYIDWRVRNDDLTERACLFVEQIEKWIGQSIDWVGIAPDKLVAAHHSMNEINH
jgi:adenylosuccinate synthase